ncbi:EAL domain-containing protein [Actinoplanes sp. NPDC000266]
MGDDGTPVRIVGWGPFRLPGERRRLDAAESAARRAISASRGAPQDVETPFELEPPAPRPSWWRRPGAIRRPYRDPPVPEPDPMADWMRLVGETVDRAHGARGPLWIIVMSPDDRETGRGDRGAQLDAEISSRLRAVLPGGSTLARLGGMFTFSHAGPKADVVRLIESIGASLAGLRPGFTMSTSVVEVRDNEVGEAFNRASSSMRATTGEDRGRVQFFPNPAAAEPPPVVYQPIVRLDTGWAEGAEAVSAVLGAEALRQLALWRDEGAVPDDFYLSIKASEAELRDIDLADRLEAGLRRSGLPPGALRVEVAGPVSGALALATLFSLRDAGIRVIRNNGLASFAALSHRPDLPVTGWKVLLAGDSADDPRITAVVRVAQRKGLDLSVDGVRTEAERERFADLGFTTGQGPLWGTALPAARFARRWGGGQRAVL